MFDYDLGKYPQRRMPTELTDKAQGVFLKHRSQIANDLLAEDEPPAASDW